MSGDELITAGGWCAPHESLYSLPDIQSKRDGVQYPAGPYVAPAPPTRRQRLRTWRKRVQERFSASRYAARRAWNNPDGWWEED